MVCKSLEEASTWRYTLIVADLDIPSINGAALANYASQIYDYMTSNRSRYFLKPEMICIANTRNEAKFIRSPRQAKAF